MSDDTLAKRADISAPAPRLVRLLPRLSPANRRRLANFRGSSRGYWSFWLFTVLFGLSLMANGLANDRPLMVVYNGGVYFPVLTDYPETAFGGDFATTVQFRDPFVQDKVRQAGGWVIWPPVRYSWDTVLREPPKPFPSPPSWTMSLDERCAGYETKAADPNCTIGNWNWVGTDDQGRDVLARIIYGFRLSVLFGLILSALSSVIGIVAGALQGYFGGWLDLLFQRFIEIWTSIPTFFVLLILSTVFAQGFWTLLSIVLLFSWTSLVGLVRAEFLRGRNFEYVRAARALGLSDFRIIFKHMLPNATVATVTFLPFIVSGSIGSLTALDYLGLGLPVGFPSLGELLQQGKANITSPWLGFTAFFVIATMLSLLVFIGEAVRDALDPRKTFV
jgi:microcin C transport system permease protein